jgi:Flp pilus assembly protein TadG
VKRHDDGAASIEFVFLGILIMVPLLYLVIAAFEVQRNAFAVTQAAREAGRAFGTAEDLTGAEERARYAMELALRDQGLEPSGTELRYGPVGGGCADGGAASLDPGTDFEVCVVRTFAVPAVPSYFDGGNNTVTGRYVVHIDNFRSVR